MLPNEYIKLWEGDTALRERRGQRLDFHCNEINVYKFNEPKARTPPQTKGRIIKAAP
jgi:hypothetical protein